MWHEEEDGEGANPQLHIVMSGGKHSPFPVGEVTGIIMEMPKNQTSYHMILDVLRDVFLYLFRHGTYQSGQLNCKGGRKCYTRILNFIVIIYFNFFLFKIVPKYMRNTISSTSFLFAHKVNSLLNLCF